MKKLYFFAILLLTGFSAFSQIVANDDAPANSINGQTTSFGVMNVLNNDTLNGNTASTSFVTLTQLSSTNTNIIVTPSGWLTVYAGVAPGVYTVTYQICQTSNLSNCDTATVTVTICGLDAPVVAPSSCLAPGSLTIGNLPTPGTWTLTQMNNNTTTTVTGSGATYTANGLVPGYYSYSVSMNGCTSVFSNAVSLGYYNGFDAAMTGVFVDFNNDGVVSIGDKVIYDIELTNTLECDITNVAVVDGNIVIPALPLSVLQAGQTVNLSGTYFITQDDVNAGMINEWAGLSGMVSGGTTYTKIFDEVPLGIPTGFQFIAFLDNNGNGVLDNGEQNFTNGHFQYEINNGGTIRDAYDNSGMLTLYETNSANTYDISYSVYNTCATAYTVNPSSYSDISVAGGGFSTYYFPITATGCVDLAVYLSPRQNPRPDFEYSHWVSYVNYGSQPASGTVTFTADPAVTVTSVSEAGAVVTPTGFTFNFANLQPNDIQYFYVTMSVPDVPIVNLGDILTSNVTITVPSGDSNTTNNTGSLDAIVTNSYDPNDISENHGPQIVLPQFDMNDELVYTVRFENTGTADAIDIDVWNYIDGPVDPSTLRIIRASDDFSMVRIGNLFTVSFDEINLPPSVEGTDIGKGYFTYAVKLLPSVQVGDYVSAVAEIYFDTNPAVLTNTWETQFVPQLAAPQFSSDDFKVYPNPAKSMLNIGTAGNTMPIESIAINDISGKTVLAKNIQSIQTAIDVSGLAKGIYLIRIKSADKEKTVKLVKE